MKRRISVVAASCLMWLPVSLLAQGSGDTAEVVKVVRVHGNAGQIANAAGSWSGAHYTVSGELNAIVVHGRPEAVASVERTIHELDALNTAEPANTNSGRDLEVTAFVIGGSNETLPGTEEVSGEALAPVVRQLRAIFPYKHYALLNTILLRSAQNGKASSRGIMHALNGSIPGSYQIWFEVGQLSPDSVSSIHLRGFHFNTQIPVPIDAGNSGEKVGRDVGVDADLDLREGQKVVVGKANVSNSDTCYFLVLSARLVP